MKIGMDLGGSNVRLLFKENGSESFVRFSYPGNLLVNENLSLFLKDKLNGNKADVIACSASGGGSADARKKITNMLHTFSENVFVFPDTKAVHYAFFGNGDGIIVISGTGSVVYGKNSGKELQIGGLGYLLGDEGGGFWFGKEFIKRGLLDMQKKKETHFSKSISEYFGTSDYTDIINRIYSSPFPSKFIADFGATVLNSEASFEILGVGAKKLAKKVRLLADTLGTKNPQIGLYGGMISHSFHFEQKLKKDIEDILKGCEFAEQKIKIEEAVLFMAEEEIEKRNN